MAEADDAMRERLGTTIRDKASAAWTTPCDEACEPSDCPSCSQAIQPLSWINEIPDTIFGEIDAIADALLPTVRAIVADELRAAGGDLADDEESDPAYIASADLLRSRADGLDPR